RLLQEDPDARSPFLAEAAQRMRQGEFEEAAAILAEGYSVTPRRQIRDKLAQICLATPHPQTALLSMENMLELALGTDIAEVLGREIRQTVDDLARQIELRRQEEAVERQRLARQAARKKEAPLQANGSGQTYDKTAAPQDSALTNGKSTKTDASLERDFQTASAKNVSPGNKGNVTIANLDVEEDFIEESGNLGDLISVMKYTWRMARRN
ncbi:MAG: hypothetical protein J5861_02195, partial [Desulfovibrio sp.]|nr:hypothetical protein [Desulfovibrio sp.]